MVARSRLSLILALALACAFASAQENPLTNPSFEEANEAGDMPAGWSWGRIYGNGPLHFEWTADARTVAQRFLLRETAGG